MKMNVYFPEPSNSSRLNFLNNLYKRFGDAHEFNSCAYEVLDYIESPLGIKDIVNWLQELGWKVKFWQIGPKINGNLIAYGFDFDENCPFFIEAMLRCDNES